MLHLDAALHLLSEHPDVGGREKPHAHARWTHGDTWTVNGVEVAYKGQGLFEVGGKQVQDHDLGAVLEFRFRWDPGILAAVDHLAAGV